MRRSLVGSVVGALSGFLLGSLGVLFASRGEFARDTSAIILFVGCFLAGTSAIAGAVVGGVADLSELLRRKERNRAQNSSK